jgi:hypothetical protein
MLVRRTGARSIAVLVCLLATVLTGACGGDADNGSDSPPVSPTTTTATPAATATPTEVVETATSTTPSASATPAPAATRGPPPRPSVASATAVRTISEAELIGVAQAIFPEVTGGFFVGCDTLANAECPVTDRLRQRLDSDSFVRLCRCQNASDTREIEPLVERLDDGGGIVRVTLYEANTSYDLVVIAGAAGWLLDDQYCAGRPETSIYADASPC